MSIILCVFYEIQYRRFVLVNEPHNNNNNNDNNNNNNNNNNNGSNDDDANDNNLEPFGENYLQYQPSRDQSFLVLQIFCNRFLSV